MKRALIVLAVAAAGAFVLVRPAPPPPAAPSGWSADPGRSHERGPRRSPPPHALAYVTGEVVRPGVYAVGPDARVRDAVALAGGTRAGADLLAVNLAAHVADGDAIVVPARGAAPPAGTTARRGRRRAASALASGPRRAAHGRHRRPRRGDAPPAAEVDINTADAETLATVPGIGDGLAERIVEFRRINGAFASVDELLDVAGITEHRLDAMIPYVVAR